MKLLVASATVVATLCWASGAFGAVSTNLIDLDSTNGVNPDTVEIVNDRGVYYVALTCLREDRVRLGYSLQADGKNDVGPGYIFAAAAKLLNGSWQTKTRDYIDVSMSDSRSGGWGKFGMHTARSTGGIQEVQGGLCFDARRAGIQPDFGAGVSRAEVFEWPGTSGGVASLGIRVFLARQEGTHDRPVMNTIARVTYRYRIDGNRVRLWTNVTSCVFGCASVFVKEPKFTASDFHDHWLTLYPQYAYLAAACTRVRCSNAPDSWPNFTCAQISGSVSPTGPGGVTSKCPDTSRLEAWFKYNTTGRVADDCGAACTWIRAQAASTYDPASAVLDYWGIGWQGLDRWAVDLTNATPWGTTGASHCNQSWNEFRRWEVGRWSPNPDDQSTSDQIAFHGWTGGSGPTDCPNLLRLVPSSERSYFNYFEFMFRIWD